MNLSRLQVELCVYGLRQLIDLVPLTPARVRPEVRGLLLQLEDMLACEPASESATATEQLTVSDPIGATQAAEILQCSPQWIRHIADDLGGHRTRSCWVFDRLTVLDYARERQSDDCV